MCVHAVLRPVSCEPPREAKLSGALDPDLHVVVVRELRVQRVHALNDDDAARFDRYPVAHFEAIPVVLLEATLPAESKWLDDRVQQQLTVAEIVNVDNLCLGQTLAQRVSQGALAGTSPAVDGNEHRRFCCRRLRRFDSRHDAVEYV